MCKRVNWLLDRFESCSMRKAEGLLDHALGRDNKCCVSSAGKCKDSGVAYSRIVLGTDSECVEGVGGLASLRTDDERGSH